MTEKQTKAEIDRLNQEIEAELLEYLEEEENKVEKVEKTHDVKFYIIIAVVFIIVMMYRLSPVISKYLFGE